MKRRKKPNIESRTGMRLLLSGVLCISPLLLTGCGREPCVTLVTCRTTSDGVVYYYDTNGTYYWKQPEEELIYPISDTGLKQEPVLTLPVISDRQEFQLLEPSRYSGTLYDVKGYLSNLESCGYSYNIQESTPTLLDIQATNGSNKVRILYIQDDVVRIYAVDSRGVSAEPPYLD